MKLFHNCTCAYCNMPLKWWKAQTCTQCHRSICDHHATITRYSQKSVLQAVCTCCTEQIEQTADILSIAVVSSPSKEYVTV